MPRETKEKKIKKQIVELNQELEKVRKDKDWKCPFCDKSSHISKIDLIVRKHYKDDYDGGYWTSSDEYWIVCPQCDVVGRHYSDASHWNPDGTSAVGLDFIVKHQSYFGSTIDMYDESSLTNCRTKTNRFEADKDNPPVQLNLKDEKLLLRISSKWRNVPHLSPKDTKIKRLKEELEELQDEE